MFGRPLRREAGFVMEGNGGNPQLSQLAIAVDATNGDSTATVQQLAGGIIQRTTVGAGFNWTTPTADQIIAAMSNPQVGDSFRLIYQNTVAQAMTHNLGTGMVAGSGTLNNAGSLTREYLYTILSNKRTVTIPCTTTNNNKNLTNVPLASLGSVMPGMGITGTGIGASNIVLGVAFDSATGLGIIYTNVNSTASADNIGVTFNPRIQIDSIGVQTWN